MSSIYEVDAKEDQFVTQLKADLIASDNGNNTDMHIVFQGYLHNKSGFKLRAENIEVFNGDLIYTWKTLIENQGMKVDITADLSNAWVQITCRRVTRHRKSLRERFKMPSITKLKFPRVPFSLLLYICILLACIIVLWTRHKGRFLK
jgi:hypothetical protein